jgi:hypothetical protein
MSPVTENQINQFGSNYTSYIKKQNAVNKNVVDISNKISLINNLYMDMSGNRIGDELNPDHIKYDFTSDTEVYTLKENRAFVPALLKDKQTMLIEHNNLYIVSTLTIATLLMTAIFMSS